MTDNEIIKALECCRDNNCNECPIEGCVDNIFREALVHINRQKEEIDGLHQIVSLLIDTQNVFSDTITEQKAEIERLENEIDKQYEQAKADILGNIPDGGASCHWCIDNIKSEAIKVFAERLKERADSGFWQEHSYVDVDDIDNLVKEMTENNFKE